MPYVIADRKIKLDSSITESDQQLLLSHANLFKYCLNNALFKYCIDLKKIVHLYLDIIVIYATLLRKVPNYDDVTIMANKCKLNMLKLEDDYNEIFGNDVNTSLHHYAKFRSSWEDKTYSSSVKPSSQLIIESTLESFEIMVKTLSCIELFFQSFSNLKKLLIPFLLEQTKSIVQSLVKLKQFLALDIPVDKLAQGALEFDKFAFEAMKKIEKVTTGIERESLILETAFLTFDGSLKHYTSILLGRAILKREVDPRDCEIFSRRGICYQAAENVVAIPLTEESLNKSNNPMDYLNKYLSYIVILLLVLISIVFYRLLKVLLG
ncbi:hypothetical protein Cantr_09417 [Candida viswanathii]|jgi:hypothetical protein|uniref:Uncharacterized protein n=1 Tax=Candida viswanathii TaxID=5486 RepID=A0A367Y9W3_9ASCO|nr:hypothetical protein Cantr_09417 [Candida viswanathii]